MTPHQSSGYGDFVRAAARGISGSRVEADRFAALGLGFPTTLAALMTYTAHSNMSKPIQELIAQIQGFPDRNGVVKVPEGPAQQKLLQRLVHARLQGKLPSHPADLPMAANGPKGKSRPAAREVARPHLLPTVVPAPNLESKYSPPPTGPDNKLMHSLNGNIKPRTARLRPRKRPAPGPRAIRPSATRAARPSKAKAKEAAIVSVEDRVAREYTRFLKDPSVPPPRLGSTGNGETKLVHGYYKATFDMAAPNIGHNLGLVNAVSFVAYINPKIIATFFSTSDFSGPIILGFANSNNATFTHATNGSVNASPFSNNSQLRTELGVVDSNTAPPPARYLGGHVSLECRCPMATVAPPYVYGGILESQPSAVGSVEPVINLGTQLAFFTGNDVKNFPSSEDVPGFEASSVYQPEAPSSFKFDALIARQEAAGIKQITNLAVPYVGMTGCPTSASVTVTVSMWFEVQKTNVIAPYSGWALGPRISDEDVFDRLPRFNSLKPYCLAQGERSNNETTRAAMAKILERDSNPPPTIDVYSKLAALEKRFAQLEVRIDDDEEEEKFVIAPDTPRYHSLSKSTIDLAMALKSQQSTPVAMKTGPTRSS